MNSRPFRARAYFSKPKKMFNEVDYDYIGLTLRQDTMGLFGVPHGQKKFPTKIFFFFKTH
jgi:hypothetical protein